MGNGILPIPRPIHTDFPLCAHTLSLWCERVPKKLNAAV